MANLEHLKAFSQGPSAWAEWGRRNPDIQPDLSGADFSGWQLDNAFLAKSNLRSTNFSGAILVNANLYETDLPGANLDNAILFDALLFNANLAGASLKRASLGGANLNFANLEGLDLRGQILNGFPSESQTPLSRSERSSDHRNKSHRSGP